MKIMNLHTKKTYRVNVISHQNSRIQFLHVLQMRPVYLMRPCTTNNIPGSCCLRSFPCSDGHKMFRCFFKNVTEIYIDLL